MERRIDFHGSNFAHELLGSGDTSTMAMPEKRFQSVLHRLWALRAPGAPCSRLNSIREIITFTSPTPETLQLSG